MKIHDGLPKMVKKNPTMNIPALGLINSLRANSASSGLRTNTFWSIASLDGGTSQDCQNPGIANSTSPIRFLQTLSDSGRSYVIATASAELGEELAAQSRTLVNTP